MLIDETTSVRIYDHPSPMLRVDHQWWYLEPEEFAALKQVAEKEELAGYRGDAVGREARRAEFRDCVRALLATGDLRPVEWEPVSPGASWSKIKGTEFKLSLAKAENANG